VATSVALQIIDVLRESGVDTVFGIPGGAISRVYAELVKRPDIRVVNATHETNAVFMAIGHALATGKPAVALTTSGPGFTNALTGLASAHADGVPVLLISGEVPRSAFGRGALQEGSSYGFDALAMARSVTKFSTQLARPTAAVTTVRKALATMTSGKPGPAFISLPLDVANAEVAQQTYAGSPQLTFKIDQGACRNAAEILCSAKRPLLLAGAGARSAQNRQAIAELARQTRTPVAVTPKGKGVFSESDELYLGVLGFGGHESVTDYLKEKPDVILVVGSSLNDFATNAWSPLLGASSKFMQIDIDAGQLGKNYPVDVALLGPMHEIIREMLLHTCNDCTRAPHPRLKFQEVPASTKGMITTAEAVQVMNEACPRDAMFTSDMGEHLGIALHFLRTRSPGSFVTCLGFGSMGSGVVGAIGLAMGDPKRRAYAICGDGGFLMSGNELQSAVVHKTPVTFVIMNDGRYNMCHHGMTEQYGAAPSCDLGGVDFAKMAQAFGAAGVVVTNPRELVDAVRMRDAGPVVIDVRIDPDARLPGNQRVAGLKLFSEGLR
jgi:acetolactate synthase-1/2/3 large subunit